VWGRLLFLNLHLTLPCVVVLVGHVTAPARVAVRVDARTLSHAFLHRARMSPAARVHRIRVPSTV
jgi:hypothetical protein